LAWGEINSADECDACDRLFGFGLDFFFWTYLIK